MAADMGFAQKAYDTGFAVAAPKVYAQGAVAIFSIRNVDFKKGIEVVRGLKAISIANPQTAPYGKASIEALKNAKLYDEVENENQILLLPGRFAVFCPEDTHRSHQFDGKPSQIRKIVVKIALSELEQA